MNSYVPKQNRRLSAPARGAALLIAALLLYGSAQALDEPFNWDTSIGDVSTITDGSGTWQNSAGNWFGNAMWDQNWQNNAKAIFGGADAGPAGTVVLGGNVSAWRLEFFTPSGGGAYVLDLNGNKLNVGANTTAIRITSDATIQGGDLELFGTSISKLRVDSGSTLTVNADIVGGGTLGATWGSGSRGTTILSGDNSITGNLSINRNTVSIGTIGLKGATSNAGAGNIVQLRAFGALTLTGSGSTTDRNLVLVNGNGHRRITNDGTGALSWTGGTFTNSNNADNHLELRGTYSGSTNTMGLILTDSSVPTAFNIEKYDASIWALTGANTYTGTTFINAGTLVAGVDDVAATSGALGNGGNVDFGGGTLQYAAGITQDYSSRIVNSTSAIIIDTNGNDVTFATKFANTNTGGLTKLGAGVLSVVLDSTSYTGLTKVDGGTVVLGNNTVNNTNTSSSGFEINNGSTLQFERGAQGILISGKTFTFDSNGGGALEVNGSSLLWRNNTIVTNGGSQNTFSGAAGVNVQNNLNNAGTQARALTFDVADGLEDVDLLVSTNVANAKLVKNGAGTVALTGAANQMTLATQTIEINNGTLEIGGAGRLNVGNYSKAITNDGTFKYNSTDDQTLSGVISGAGVLTKDNVGTLTLTEQNTYTGNTTVTAGTLRIDGNGALHAANGIYGGDISIASGATFRYSSSASNTDARYNGAISGGGTFIKDVDNSTLRLQGTTTVDAIEINQGTLRSQGVNGAGGAGTTVSLGDTSGSNFATLWYTAGAATTPTKAGIVVRAGSLGTKTIRNSTTGGSLIEKTPITLNDDLTINDSELMTLGGVISGSGGLTKTNLGTTTLSGTNTYSGDTAIGAGTLEIGGTGTLQSGSYAGAIANTGTLHYNSSTDQELSGLISGSGALLKESASTLTLSGNNNYSGTTSVDDGTLLVNGTSSGGGSVNVASGATLGGTGTIGGTVTVASGGIFSPGTP